MTRILVVDDSIINVSKDADRTQRPAKPSEAWQRVAQRGSNAGTRLIARGARPVLVGTSHP